MLPPMGRRSTWYVYPEERQPNPMTQGRAFGTVTAVLGLPSGGRGPIDDALRGQRRVRPCFDDPK